MNERKIISEFGDVSYDTAQNQECISSSNSSFFQNFITVTLPVLRRVLVPLFLRLEPRVLWRPGSLFSPYKDIQNFVLCNLYSGFNDQINTTTPRGMAAVGSHGSHQWETYTEVTNYNMAGCLCQIVHTLSGFPSSLAPKVNPCTPSKTFIIPAITKMLNSKFITTN